ncbi:MAG: universal stress protein [Anaerolineaceae bacterium]
MFSRILVPLDGSSLAERAIPHAVLFARIFRSDIILLQVLEPTSYHENPKSVDPLNWQIRKTEADMYMLGIADQIRKELENKSVSCPEEKSISVEYFVREGKTAENIVDFAHTENIDLLIISTHGSSGFSRWNISSITEKVVKRIYLPVLIIRSFRDLEVNEPLNRYHKILLPIDSSRRAECSLSAAIELTRGEMAADVSASEDGEKSTLVLAAVIRPPEIPIPEPYPVKINLLSNQLRQISRQAVDKYLTELKIRLPVQCETRVVEKASVISALQELADEDDIDMVVLCAHGHSGQDIWPYGTVTLNYIEHGTKPVLIIQDVPLSHVRATAAEIAAEKSRSR